MNRNKAITLALLSIAVLIGVSACAKEGSADSSVTPVENNEPAADAQEGHSCDRDGAVAPVLGNDLHCRNGEWTQAAPPTPTEPRPTTTTAPEPAGPTAIGQAFTWEDGLSIIVTDIVARPLDPGYGSPVPDGVVATIQIQNNTSVVFDGSLFQANLSFGPAGAQAQSAFYTNEGLTGGLEGPIPPGGTATINMGWEGVTDPSVLLVSVEPNFDYDPAFWQK